MSSAIEAARIPLAGLPSLAALRSVAAVTVVSTHQHAWIRWSDHPGEVLATLLAVPGVECFIQRDGQWHRPGESLPVFDVPPPGEAIPLERLLFPAPFTAISAGVVSARRLMCRLMPSARPSPATVLRCDLRVLHPWVEMATTAELRAVRACLCDDRVLLIGERLPWAEPAERYWGRDVLIPLGHRPEPDWNEAALREAAGVARDELLLIDHDHTEVIPRAILEPLSRAAWRRVIGAVEPSDK